MKDKENKCENMQKFSVEASKNMQDKEMIEEMAYDCCRLTNKPMSCSNCMWQKNCNSYENAKTYVKQGYRKLPKGAKVFIPTDEQYIMLSKEEFVEFEKKKEYLLCKEYGLIRYDKEIKQQASKETAEKIYEGLIYIVDALMLDDIKEMIKTEIGVEIKE